MSKKVYVFPANQQMLKLISKSYLGDQGDIFSSPKCYGTTKNHRNILIYFFEVPPFLGVPRGGNSVLKDMTFQIWISIKKNIYFCVFISRITNSYLIWMLALPLHRLIFPVSKNTIFRIRLLFFIKKFVFFSKLRLLS